MKIKKILVILLPILTILLMFIVKTTYAKFINGKFLPCWFNLLTGYLCPGCGGTRSFYALMNGDIISSFEYNAFVPIMAIFSIVLYFRMFEKVVMGKNISILPHNDKWIYIPLIMFLVYFIIRNFI